MVFYSKMITVLAIQASSTFYGQEKILQELLVKKKLVAKSLLVILGIFEEPPVGSEYEVSWVMSTAE